MWVANSRLRQASKKKLADCTVTARLLARLDVLVGWLADPWYLACYGWDRQLLGCRRPCDGTTSYRLKNTVSVGTYEHHCLYLRLFKAVTGQISQGRILDRSWLVNRSWLGAFNRWQNLAGHIAYRIFDRLPVKYPVPRNKRSENRLFYDSTNWNYYSLQVHFGK